MGNEGEEQNRIKCGDYFRVLRDYPAYRLLLFSYFIDNLGNWFTFISCLTITDNFGGVIWTTIYLMIRLIPSFIFAPCLGPLADKYDKRLGMICCSILSAAVVLFMAGIITTGDSLTYFQLFGIYCASLIQFTLDTLYGPLRGSLIPLLVKKEDLMITSTWDGFGWSTISAFGASIGGYVTSKYGYRAAFLLDASSYLFCAVLVYFVPTVTVPADSTTTPESQTMPHSTTTSLPKDQENSSGSSYSMNREMITYLYENPFILVICFLRGSGSLLWGAADLLSIQFSNIVQLQHYGDKEFTLGLIYATVGIGCQVGPMFWNAITPQSEYYLFRVNVISFGQIAISYAIMMSTTHINHLLLATFIRSMASGIIYIYGGLMIQLLVPSSMQGRIFTIERAIYMLSKMISTIMSGIGFDSFHWNEYQMSLFMSIFGGVVTIIWSGIFLSHYHIQTTLSTSSFCGIWLPCCNHHVSLKYQKVARDDEEAAKDLEMIDPSDSVMTHDDQVDKVDDSLELK